MADRQVDPARLSGAALKQWYLRTPAEIEQERRDSQARQYQDFFGAARSADDPSSTRGDVQPAFANRDDMLWVATGRGGYRAIRPQSDRYRRLLDGGESSPEQGHLPINSAEPEGGEFIDVGNPHHPRLRREWERREGRSWPMTADDRRYDVSHKRAIADGGDNALDNIEPLHPDEHRTRHTRNDDFGRWARRQFTARAFGGKVEPPLHGRTMRGFGPLGAISNITGLLSGRIRTDSFSNFATDMVGIPSLDEYRAAWRKTPVQRQDCPPGWQCT